MTPEVLDETLRRFRRQVIVTQAARLTLAVLLAAAIFWASQVPEPGGRNTMLLLVLAALMVWTVGIASAARAARELQTGRVLLGTGQLNEAETWFTRAMQRFSLSLGPRLLACHQLASLLFKREAYADTVLVCRELLRHRLTSVKSLWVSARLLLADSLLRLCSPAEAYEAIRPVYETPLSLADRMRLLPIQLRYELATGHSASAVQSLEEKVRIAELLDSPGAALVHALLAEACRREAMPAQQAYLTERARLYHDLAPLAESHVVIAPIAEAARHVDGAAEA